MLYTVSLFLDSYSTDGLVRQNTALHKPVTQHSTSVNKTLPSSLETLDVMDKYFREMRKTMGMENKNKTEVFHEDAVPHPAIPKDLKGMNRTVQREPVKYRMLLRRQKNPQIDQKLEYLASRKYEETPCHHYANKLM